MFSDTAKIGFGNQLMCNIDEMIATDLFQEAQFPMKSAGNPHRCMVMHEFNHYN